MRCKIKLKNIVLLNTKYALFKYSAFKLEPTFAIKFTLGKGNCENSINIVLSDLLRANRPRAVGSSSIIPRSEANESRKLLNWYRHNYYPIALGSLAPRKKILRAKKGAPARISWLEKFSHREGTFNWICIVWQERVLRAALRARVLV